MRSLKNNNGYALILGVVIAIFLGIFLAAAFTSGDVQMMAVQERSAAQLAFYAAEAGVEESLFQLRRNENWRPDGTETQVQLLSVAPPPTAGYYNVQVANAPLDPKFPSFPAVWVRSDGQDPDREITRAILAKVVLFNPAEFFVSSMADIRAGSGSTYHGDMLGRNVYFEINDSIPDSDPAKKIVLHDDCFYFRNVYGDSNPFVEFLGNPPQSFSTITFPGVDTARYRDLALAGGKYVNGDYLAPISITRANIFDDPSTANGIVFAEGDIYISGQYDDSLLFVSGGDIYINGDLKASTGGGPAPQLGLFSKQDIIIPESSPSDMTVEAFLIADGGGASYGQLTAYGDKFSKGTFNFSGAMAVRGLQEDGTSPRTAFNLNVFATRNYNYDSNLRDSCTIPFMAFVANMVDWEEINPNDAFPPP